MGYPFVFFDQLLIYVLPNHVTIENLENFWLILLVWEISHGHSCNSFRFPVENLSPLYVNFDRSRLTNIFYNRSFAPVKISCTPRKTFKSIYGRLSHVQLSAFSLFAFVVDDFDVLLDQNIIVVEVELPLHN